MKKKQLRTWTAWESDEEVPIGVPPVAPIRVTLVTSSGLPGRRRLEVLELDHLRWGYEMSVVPGPQEIQ